MKGVLQRKIHQHGWNSLSQCFTKWNTHWLTLCIHFLLQMVPALPEDPPGESYFTFQLLASELRASTNIVLTVQKVHTHYFGHFATFTERLHSKGMRHIVHGDGVDLNDTVILTGKKRHKEMGELWEQKSEGVLQIVKPCFVHNSTKLDLFFNTFFVFLWPFFASYFAERALCQTVQYRKKAHKTKRNRSQQQSTEALRRTLASFWHTYKSNPSAGPPCSTSDTMIDVSPLSTLGLSRPPETAMPKPILESYRKKNQLANSVHSDRTRLTAALSRTGARVLTAVMAGLTSHVLEETWLLLGLRSLTMFHLFHKALPPCTAQTS